MSRKKISRKADTVFYVPRPQIAGEAFVLADDNFRHAVKVLRQEVGSTIDVVDGEGGVYRASIQKIDSRKALCKIESEERLGERSAQITIAVGIMNSRDRFETLVEKAQELGASTVWELETDHSAARPARHDRLVRIAVAAMKQSRRARLLRMSGPSSLADFVASDNSDCKLVCSMDPGSPLLSDVMRASSRIGTVSILVGPEGGFSRDEEELLADRGYVSASLGSSRLRTETAGIAALSIVRQFVGEV
jgi:16S rRNA (uracil1498-N3)-methyltransferase